MEQAQQDSEAKLLDHIDNMLSKKKKAQIVDPDYAKIFEPQEQVMTTKL